MAAMKPLVLLLGLALITSVQAKPIPTENEVALDKLNASFRQQYALSRDENLAAMPLLIVLETGKVTWITKGKRQQKEIPLARYTQTKILMHALLGAYGVGSRLVRDGATKSELKAARELLANINKAMDLVPKDYMTKKPEKGVASNSRPICGDRWVILDPNDEKLYFLLYQLRGEVGIWIQCGLNQEQLEQSLRPLRQDAMEIVNQQAKEHFQHVREALLAIRKTVPATDWQKAVVVVPGGAAARRDRLEVAAAMSVLGRSALNHRIFYAENVYDVDGAIQIVAGLEIDRALAETFFDDPTRMWRDLLGDDVKGEVGGDFYPGLAH